MDNLMDALIQSGRYTTFVRIVQIADYAAMLREDGQFTVFAPAEKAFARLPSGMLGNLFADPAQCRAVAGLHLVPGAFTLGDIADQGIRLLPTVNGLTLPVRISLLGRLHFADAAVSSVEEYVFPNGVIHEIDRVILPPAQAQERAA